MKKIALSLCLLAGISLLLVACSKTKQTPLDQYKGQSADQIFNGGVSEMLKRRYKSASQHFKALDGLYPFSEHTQQAQLDIIYTYYMSGDVASTLAACDRYIRLYPRSQDVDYAYYIRGMTNMYQHRGILEHFFPSHPSNRDLMGVESAYRDFDLIVKAHPHSSYTGDAIQRMIFVRNVLAQHQLNVAQQYYNRKAYIGAVNRASGVIQHYQQSPAASNALIIMTRCYRQLGLTKQADQALKILEYNFPNSNYITEAKKG